MKSTEVINIIFIILLLAILMVSALVAWSLIEQRRLVTTIGPNTLLNLAAGSETTTANGDLLQSCAVIPCKAGLMCDGVTYTCKKATGVACNNFAECIAGNYCSGICTFGPTGGLDQNCPCGEGYSCVLQNDGHAVCKGINTPCKSGSDCVSFDCINGFCEPGFPNSFPCKQNFQCQSNNCSLGFCQPSGLSTGNLGAACSGNCVSFNGAGCRNTTSQSLVCQCPGNGQPGTCVNNSNGLFSFCSNSNVCSALYNCYSQNGPDTECTGSNCLCKFNYQNPNSAVNGCINGMENIGGICKNSFMQSCDNDLQCSSSKCGNTATLSTYGFTGPGFSFSGTTDVSMSSVTIPYNTFTPIDSTKGPEPKKCFAGSQGALYIVDLNYGLLGFQSGNWLQILQGKSNTRGILIDACLRRFTSQVCFLAYSNSGQYSVYSGSTFDTTVSYNGGVQYDLSSNAINIEYIEASNTNDSNFSVILTSPNGNVYLKKMTDTKYQVPIVSGGPYNGHLISCSTGPAKFYFDTASPDYQNISFVNTWNPNVGQFTEVIQFSGPLAGPISSIGFAIPIDPYKQLYYKVYNYDSYTDASGSSNVAILALCGAYSTNDNSFQFNVAFLYYQGDQVAMQYQIGNSFIPGLTNNSYNFVSKGNCS